MAREVLSQTEKADQYDRLIKEIAAREPSIHRALGGNSSGYKYLPVHALLRAFDILVDENKREGFSVASKGLTHPRARERNFR